MGYDFVDSSNKNTFGIPLSAPSASDVGGRTIRLHYSNERIFLVCVNNAINASEERISEYCHYFEYIADKPLSQCNPVEYLSAWRLIDTIGNYPVSKITCSPFDDIGKICYSKYKIDDDDKLARFFEGVYRAFLWNKKGYSFIIPDLLVDNLLNKPVVN
ncbi:MAG: hypothetical protein LBM93_04930 [Oscillospiraceae bacterium]|nr:hypothetical protein [Oscillospiraceae bacterium]